MPVAITSKPYDAHAVARVAASQWGVVTTRQLHEAGLSDPAIHRMERAGRLHRLYRGVYAVGHARLSREGRWMAAVLAAGEGAVVSHVSAAQHWGITRRRDGAVHIARPRQRRPLPGVRAHLLRPLQEDGAVTSHEGVPVTTVTRTIIDLAEVMDAEELAHVMHEAAYHHVVDVDAVRQVIDAHPRFRGRGVLRAALAMHLAGDVGARSRFERRLREYLASVGVPNPRAGYVLRTPQGRYEVDMAWPERRIALEADGVGHARPRARRVDRERDAALRAAGWTTYRVRQCDFDADPAAATAAIRSAFA